MSDEGVPVTVEQVCRKMAREGYVLALVQNMRPTTEGELETRIKWVKRP